MTMDYAPLIGIAMQAKAAAYAPYSGFHVGCAILCSDGTVFFGCNVEAGAALSVCAERTALVKAVSEGQRTFEALAVCGDSDDFCTPCGTCRQMLYEFAPDMPVLCCNVRGEYETHTVRQLLPFAFGEEKRA